MSQKTKIVNDKTLTQPIIMREGDERAITIRVIGATSIASDATLTVTMYKQGASTDLSSTYLTGSMSVSGNTITTKTTTGLKQGEYLVSVKATVDSVLRIVATIPLIVKRRSEV